MCPIDWREPYQYHRGKKKSVHTCTVYRVNEQKGQMKRSHEGPLSALFAVTTAFTDRCFMTGMSDNQHCQQLQSFDRHRHLRNTDTGTDKHSVSKETLLAWKRVLSLRHSGRARMAPLTFQRCCGSFKTQEHTNDTIYSYAKIWVNLQYAICTTHSYERLCLPSSRIYVFLYILTCTCDIRATVPFLFHSRSLYSYQWWNCCNPSIPALSFDT